MVKLKHPIIGVIECSIQQAINVMSMQNNGGWNWNNKKDAKLLKGAIEPTTSDPTPQPEDIDVSKEEE